MLEKTIIFHLFILNALSEKKKGISAAEDKPEAAETPQSEFRDKKIN